jgi:hypothetical protein
MKFFGNKMIISESVLITFEEYFSFLRHSSLAEAKIGFSLKPNHHWQILLA